MKFVGKNCNDEVAVCTEDYGMMLRCEAHGIAIIEPPKDIRLENPSSETEKKYKAAVTELQSLKHRDPKLNFVVYDPQNSPDSGVPFSVSLSRSEASSDPAQETEKERERIRLSGLIDSLIPQFSFMRSFFAVAEDDRKRYESKLEEYFTSYEKWVRLNNEYQGLIARAFKFSIQIANIGKCPVSDLYIEIRFPTIFRFLQGEGDSKGELVKCPTPPSKPKPPRQIFNQLALFPKTIQPSLYSSSMFDAIARSDSGSPNCEIIGVESEEFRIVIRLQKLNHNMCVNYGPFEGLLQSWEDAISFQAHLFATASNLLDPITLDIPFVLEEKTNSA